VISDTDDDDDDEGDDWGDEGDEQGHNNKVRGATTTGITLRGQQGYRGSSSALSRSISVTATAVGGDTAVTGVANGGGNVDNDNSFGSGDVDVSDLTSNITTSNATVVDCNDNSYISEVREVESGVANVVDGTDTFRPTVIDCNDDSYLGHPVISSSSSNSSSNRNSVHHSRVISGEFHVDRADRVVIADDGDDDDNDDVGEEGVFATVDIELEGAIAVEAVEGADNSDDADVDVVT
jgi:hypothetical protein